MKLKNPLIKGAILLTAAGLITRIIGFFYRIFLSRTIGAEGMGLYQLIFPIYGIVFSLSIAPIQTSISRFVAAEKSGRHADGVITTFAAGLISSLIITTFLAFFVYINADWISCNFIKEPRCADLVKILAVSLPLGSVHSCINGYYYGIQKAVTPSVSQLTEQVTRVIAVYILSCISLSNTGTVTPAAAVCGLVIGDAASMIYCIVSIFLDKKNFGKISGFKKQFKNIFNFSAPLAINRLLLSILHSIESVLIPIQLRLSGMSDSNAIGLFGILTGMALPFIQFPSAVPNAIALMLLPEVAAAATDSDENGNTRKNSKLSRSSASGIEYSLLLGILCTGIFLVYGKEMGIVIFKNNTAGIYISTLSWLCPFMYLTTTLGSILNGLGDTAASFIHNVISVLIRLGFVFFLIPRYGIMAYLWGTLISQLAITILHYMSVQKRISLSFNALYIIILPVLSLIISIIFTKIISILLIKIGIPVLLLLLIKCGSTAIIYIALLYLFKLFNFGIHNKKQP